MAKSEVCQTLEDLQSCGGYAKNSHCPFRKDCPRNLDPEDCTLVQTVAILDNSQIVQMAFEDGEF